MNFGSGSRASSAFDDRLRAVTLVPNETAVCSAQELESEEKMKVALIGVRPAEFAAGASQHKQGLAQLPVNAGVREGLRVVRHGAMVQFRDAFEPVATRVAHDDAAEPLIRSLGHEIAT